MKKKIMLSLMTISLVAALVGGATFAWFTSDASSKDNIFTSGKLEVGLKDDNEAFTGGNNVTKTFAVSGLLQPGDYVTKGTDNKAVIEIKNTGTLNETILKRFNISSDTKGLKNALVFQDWKVEWLDPNGNAVLTENILDNGKWTGLYNMQSYAGNDGKLSLAEYQAMNGFAMGEWDYATLKPDYSWRMTFRLKFDEALGTNDYQDASLTGNFEAHATQVNANALQEKADALGIIYNMANAIPEAEYQLSIQK